MKQWRRQLDRWLLGLTNSSMQGGASAVDAFLAMAAANAVGMDVPKLSFDLIGAIFLFSAGRAFFKYLSLNPLPELPEVPAAGAAPASTQRPS
jgi:hypothetical protein